MIHAVVDRIEGDWLILVPESGPVFQVPEILFPDYKEGDIVNISFEKDEEGKKDIGKRISEIREDLNRINL